MTTTQSLRMLPVAPYTFDIKVGIIMYKVGVHVTHHNDVLVSAKDIVAALTGSRQNTSSTQVCQLGNQNHRLRHDGRKLSDYEKVMTCFFFLFFPK